MNAHGLITADVDNGNSQNEQSNGAGRPPAPKCSKQTADKTNTIMINQRPAKNAETNMICYLPIYIIYSAGRPTVCNDFNTALDTARKISQSFANENKFVRIFNTLLGDYTITYRNGIIIR